MPPVPDHRYPVVAKFMHDFLVKVGRSYFGRCLGIGGTHIVALPKLPQFTQPDGLNGICFNYFMDKCVNEGYKFHHLEKHQINDKFSNDVLAIIRPGMEYVWANGMPDR